MEERVYPVFPLQKAIDITALHTAFARQMETERTSSGEIHNFWEILVVSRGEISVATGQDIFTLGKQEMVIHKPMEFHRHFNPGTQTSTYGVISFDAPLMLPAEAMTYPLAPELVQEFFAIIRLIRENTVTDKLSPLALRGRDISQEVKSRLELFLLQALAGDSRPHRNFSPEYKKIMAFLSENAHAGLTLPEIARQLHMSVSNVKLIFSRYSGMGVMKYYTNLKMQAAVTYLGEGLSVKEVAERLSYSSQSAFCTAFKNHTGLPPSQYSNRKD